MKRFIFGMLAGLGAVGVYTLYRQGKLPALRVKGTVKSVNPETGTFEISPNFDKNIGLTFGVTPDTKFSWLANTSGGSNAAEFEDLASQEKVSVAFVRDKMNGQNVAERVILESLK